MLAWVVFTAGVVVNCCDDVDGVDVDAVVITVVDAVIVVDTTVAAVVTTAAAVAAGAAVVAAATTRSVNVYSPNEVLR